MFSPKTTILVVDDNPATRYSTSRVLRSAGWDVLESETGLSAIELAQTGVDLVILDVNYPTSMDLKSVASFGQMKQVSVFQSYTFQLLSYRILTKFMDWSQERTDI